MATVADDTVVQWSARKVRPDREHSYDNLKSQTMCTVWRVVPILLVQLVRAEELYCFQCSDIDTLRTNSCPTNSTDISVWKQKTSQYTATESSTYRCVTAIGGDKKVYLQGSTSATNCQSDNYKTKILQGVTSKGGAGGELFCCSKSGCNWNGTTAQKNLHIDDFENESLLGSAISTIKNASTTWIPILIISLVLALLLLICCIVFCCRKCCKKDEEEEDANGKTGRWSLFDIRKDGNSGYGDRGWYGDRASNKSTRGGQRIDVKQYDPKDNERYSAIDRRINGGRQNIAFTVGDDDLDDFGDPNTKRTQDRIGHIGKEVFDTEDFQQVTRGVHRPKPADHKPEWVNVWRNQAGAEGRPEMYETPNVNAFSFKD